MEPPQVTEETLNPKPPYRLPWYVISIFSLTAVLGCYIWLGSAPKQAILPQTFTVNPGMSVAAIAGKAEQEHLVRSSLFLYILLTIKHDPTSIFAGNYTFTTSTSVYGVARKLSSGEIDDESIRLTIPEGLRIHEIAKLVHENIPTITEADYTEAAIGHEGYLYPDTYHIPPQFSANDIVALQKQTYEERVTPLREKIVQSGQTESDIITLASIIEREANDEISMKMVSGIFHNRLDIGMALQADATIEYALDSALHELKDGELADHLREIDSPYNTYKYAGLPPTPIGNPGHTAILAALEPTPSEYFYYITGNDGIFYYAKTLEAHEANIVNHLY